MLKEIRAVAENLGITLVIAKSDEDIDTQVNRITRIEDLPIMLSSWDLKVKLEFDTETGFLKNPTVDVTMLLITKASSTAKEELELKAEEMGVLFTKFTSDLKKYLTLNTNVKQDPIKGIGFTYVPSFGSGKHSGVLGKFNVQQNLDEGCL
jgi:hypothetical protein